MIRKTDLIIACCAVAASVACISTESSAGLLGNSGFEDLGLSPWGTFSFTGRATTVDTTMPHSGSNAALEAGATATTGSTGVFQVLSNVKPGEEYFLDVWAKAGALPITTDDSNGGPVVRIVFEEIGGADITLLPIALGPLGGSVGNEVTGNGLLTTEYQKFSVSGIAPAGTEQLRIQLYTRHMDQPIYFDDAELTFIPEPTTPTLYATIDRGTGALTIDNIGQVDFNIKSYSLTSANGSLDQSNWTSIAGNYDSGGPGSIDNTAWTRTSTTTFDLSEGDTNADGGTITPAQAAIDLGTPWIKSPFEDVVLTAEFPNGTTENVRLEFVGGPTGFRYARSDLNFDGSISAADWPALRDNLLSDFSAMSAAQAYQHGDLDNDGDNDIIDFGIFKSDFDAANGVGAFDTLLATVPEPSSLLLLAVGVLGVALTRRRHIQLLPKGACVLAVVGMIGVLAPCDAHAQAIDFTTFTVDNYPGTTNENFNLPTYTTTATTATPNISPNPHVFYGTQSILGKRITGTINPGSDDDFVGLALGYTAGDTSNTSADFLLLDWKQIDQTFNFTDDVNNDPFQFFHDLTLGQEALAGLALSRVSGTPTGDELWGHINDLNNSSGGVTELQRGATLGSTGYSNNKEYSFDITYTATNVIVKVDGAEEINVSGTFPDGVLGLYSSGQFGTQPPVHSNFSLSNLDSILTATVNVLSGDISLSNGSPAPINIDFYQFISPADSLEFDTWDSLEDQNLAGFPAGNGTGNGWEEGGGSSDAALAEAYLQNSSSVDVGESVSIGDAYDTVINAQDLAFTYRDSNGVITIGQVNYVSTIEDADFDGDSDVDGEDFLIWQRGFGTGTTQAQGDANGSGAVDEADLAIWGSQFGTTSTVAAVGSVPEPSAFVLLLLAACGLGIRERGKY